MNGEYKGMTKIKKIIESGRLSFLYWILFIIWFLSLVVFVTVMNQQGWMPFYDAINFEFFINKIQVVGKYRVI